MNPCRALRSRYLSEGNVFALGPGQWGWGVGVEVYFGVSESSLPVLEEEGLECGVSCPEASSPGW